MTSEQWRQIEDLYGAAKQRGPAERATLFASVDPEIRSKVERMLAQDSDGKILDRSADSLLDEATRTIVSMGSRLGPYEIESELGAGGMGKVYLARDTRLGRQVAIKVSHERFSARFEREARAIASLNHPNICQLYDVGDNYLVMELIEGPTLQERIRQGPLPVEEAVPIARQISDALDAAQEKGIIHRDLKPGNIKLKPDGTVKVLDFGLAKVAEGSGVASDASRSPTIGMDATVAGMILGTAYYMAPEQAKGHAVDKRADIWAFGVVLFEMLSGRKPFEGGDVPEILAAIFRAEPEWVALPKSTPANIRALLERCLEKDPKRRLRDIGDTASWLESATEAVPIRQASRPWLVWGLTALAFILIALLLVIEIPRLREGSTSPDLVRFAIPLPETMNFAPHGDFAVSPDGRQLVFAASGTDNVVRLWLRPLDSPEARMLPATEGASFPFWSPESKYVAFSASGKLKTIDVSSGTIQSVCDFTNTFRFLGVGGLAWGGSWNRDGIILFGSAPLMRVSARGGTPVPVTALDSSRQESVHAFPSFLPDGKHFLYTRVSETGGKTAIYIGLLDSKPGEQDLKPLLPDPGKAIYVPSADSAQGQILFSREGTLLAQPFDAGRLELTGDPVSVAESVGGSVYLPSYSYDFFSASATGLLIYRPNVNQQVQLTWFDRKGNMLEHVGDAGRISYPRVSPDGTRVLFTKYVSGNERDVSIHDSRNKGGDLRITFSGRVGNAVWSPDGNSIAYLTTLPGGYRVYRKASNGGGTEQLLLESPDPQNRGATLLDWSSDGYILLQRHDAKARLHLWLLSANGDQALIELPHSADADEFGGRISKDGRWVGYVSNLNDKLEVNVQPYNPAAAAQGPPAQQWQVSHEGGFGLLGWRSDRRELLYLDSDRGVMAVDLAPGPVFHTGVPTFLFRASRFNTNPSTPWVASEASPDGSRFLFELPVDEPEFEVVMNWRIALKK